MFVYFYLLAAAVLLWAKYDSALPPGLVSASVVVAWIGAGAAVLSDFAVLIGIPMARLTPRVLLEEALQEEEGFGLLRWWQFPFAVLLIAAEWGLLSAIAAVAAVLRWPISVMYLRVARARLAALQPPVVVAPEGDGA